MKRILPSYPLFVKDPYFSIWSSAEILNEQETKIWFGETKNIYGFIKVFNETYCFLGDADKFKQFGVKKAEQTKINVEVFSTDYEFNVGGAILSISFVSPVPLNDLNLLSMPVCYMKYSIMGVKQAEISLMVNRNVCYNDVEKTIDKRVRLGVMPLNGFESAFMGLARQRPLSTCGDEIGADWGYYYLAGEEAFVLDKTELEKYFNADFTFQCIEEDRYMLAKNTALTGTILFGYDDGVSIEYFGDYLKGYYLEDKTIVDALIYVYNNYDKIDYKLSIFEKDLISKAQVYGDDYVDIIKASYRQTIGAHKLVRDKNGDILWLSKECGSDGCIATVDVSYPSMPLFLLYNTELVKGMMRPILKFSRYPVWKYDFAPHDVGSYPICSGQLYSIYNYENKYHGRYGEGGFLSEFNTSFPIYLLPREFDAYWDHRQMPIEECANMLIMFLAVVKNDNDKIFFKVNRDLCDKWVEYLVKYGLKPENQLCTDDFAGHSANNINLAIKATVAIACYAQLLKYVDEQDLYVKYRKIAENYAKEISDFSVGKTHIPMTWDDGEETFSLKYNFAFDKALGLNLFSQKIYEKEVDYYITKLEKYGVPLDNRATYTKSDWICWVAYLTEDIEKKKKLIAPINKYLKETADRIPFSDWYETVCDSFTPIDQSNIYFKARSVQGGLYILLI